MLEKQAETTAASDETLLARARRREEAAARTIIRQNNRRLFRMARAILKDDTEAEDVVQESYVRAFTHLADFRAEAALSTWLTRIVINEAYGRLRRRRPTLDWESAEPALAAQAQIIPFPSWSSRNDPETAMAQNQIHGLLDRAIDALPERFRTVLVARLVEEMSVEETAELLNLRPETVKTRLHRARLMLRADLERQIGPALTGVFPFAGPRCERMAKNVLTILRATA
jgi:RNA polymerase sigma-70 factor (ECF subfamily)